MECKSDYSNTREDTKYRDVIERHISSPVVADVLTSRSSFTTRVESFYDFVRSCSGCKRGVCKPPKKLDGSSNINDSPNKIEQYPKDLVDILNHFTEEPFDISKLTYRRVQEDYQRIIDFRKKKRNIASAVGAVVASGVAAIGIGLLYYFSGKALSDPVDADTIAKTIGIGAFSLIPAFICSEVYEKANFRNYFGEDEFKECLKLHRTAEKADAFIHNYSQNLK